MLEHVVNQIPLKLYLNTEDVALTLIDELCKVLPRAVVIPNSMEFSVWGFTSVQGPSYIIPGSESSTITVTVII